jgi:hypothetical protein
MIAASSPKRKNRADKYVIAPIGKSEEVRKARRGLVQPYLRVRRGDDALLFSCIRQARGFNQFSPCISQKAQKTGPKAEKPSRAAPFLRR